MILLRTLTHWLAPSLHLWVEMADGPLRWTCAGCGATAGEYPL